MIAIARPVTLVTMIGLAAASLPRVSQLTKRVLPIPPFLSSDPRDVRARGDCVRQNLEAYFDAITNDMRCLHTKRAFVFQKEQAMT